MLLDSLDCTYYVKLPNNIIFVLLKFNDGLFLSSHVFTLLISLVMISSSRFKFSPEQKILVSSANKTRLVDQEPGTEEQTDQQGLGGRQGSQTGRGRQLAGSEKYEESSRGKALRNSGDNLAGNVFFFFFFFLLLISGRRMPLRHIDVTHRTKNK